MRPRRAARLRGGDAAALGGGGVQLLDPAEPAVQRRLLRLDHRHRDAGVGEAHRDAAAHRAGADHRRPRDRPRLVPFGSRDLLRLALGEEGVALRPALVAGTSFSNSRRSLARPSSNGSVTAPRTPPRRCAAHARRRPSATARPAVDQAGSSAAGCSRRGRARGAARRRARQGDRVVRDRRRPARVDQADRRRLRAGDRVAGTIMASAFSTPTTRGRRCVPPAPGRMPSLTSGRPSRAVGQATRAWQPSASSSPPPSATPLMAATTGLAMPRSRRSRRAGWAVGGLPNSVMSAPPLKARAVPASTTARTAGSARPWPAPPAARRAAARPAR